MTAVLLRLRTVALSAALFAAPLIFWAWSRDAYHLVKEAALAVFVLPALAAWFLLSRPGAGQVPRWYAAVAAAFLAWALARIHGGADTVSALLRGGEWVLTFCAAAAALGFSARDRRAALDALFASTALAAVMGIAQYFYGRQFLTPFAVDADSVTFTSDRVFSTFGNPVFFAGYLALVIPLTAGCLAAARPQSRRFYFLLASGLLQLIALVLTASRGAFLGLGAGLALLALSARSFRKWAAALAVTVSVLLLVSWLLRPELVRHLTAGGDPGRLLMWRTAWAMWKAVPAAGVGLGQFTREYPCVQSGIATPGESGFGTNAGYAHNDFLEAGAELGIPGAALFLALVAGILFLPGTGIEARAFKAGVIAVSVHGLFHFPFHTIPVMVFVWMLAALVFFPGRKRPASGGSGGTRVVPVRFALAMGGAIVMAATAIHPLMRSSYFQYALAYQDARMYPRAGDLFARALILMPDDSQSRIVYHAGKLMFDAGDLDGAKRQFERDMLLNPCYPEGYGTLGVVYGVKAQRGEPGALNKARELVGKALRLRPGGREAAQDYISLGNLGVIEGSEGKALAAYLMAVKCDSGNADAAVNACHLLLKTNRRKEAGAIVAEALRAHPGNPDLVFFARRLGVLP